MADVMEVIDSRRGEKSIEEFAQEMGLTGSALYYYKKKQRGMRIDSLRKMASYFNKKGDLEAVLLLASFAVDVDLRKILVPSS